MLPVLARIRSLWNGIRTPIEAGNAEMDEELRYHMELCAADLVRTGLSPAEATRRARLEFGSTEAVKDDGRRARGLGPFDALRVSWLDFKLGFRMLARYPGLTIIGGVAIAFAIWVGAGTFELISQGLRPTLPLPDGHRIIAVELWNVQTNRPEARLLHDVAAWRTEASTVEDLGAYRSAMRNLTVGREGLGEPILIAEIDASAFRVVRVAPLMGRGLVDADELPSAPNAVVIGYRTWQTRFDSDPAVVGQTVRLGGVKHVVVGVMPKGFGFPIAHKAWVPLRLNAADYPVGEGPALSGVFGRLARGVSKEQAQAELSAIGARRSASLSATHEYLRPRIASIATPMFNRSGTETAAVWSINLFLVMLLVLVCGNVALLMFARAASRDAEIIVRIALGASRARIVMQFFAEALVLGAVGALAGLSMVDYGLKWVLNGAFGNVDGMPFWIRDRISPLTVVYIVALTLIGAVITGIVPALKVTRGLSDRLKAIGTGGGGLKFGGVWTAIIIVQVALTLAFPTVTYFVYGDTREIRATNIGVPTREYLTAQVQMERNPPGMEHPTRAAISARFDAATRELVRRLRADAGVRSVTLAERLPFMYHPHRIVELDEGPAAPRNPHWPDGYRVSDAAVDIAFFETFDAPALDGRLFQPTDFEPAEGHQPVIVNQAFVHLVMGGRSPIGRRLRYVYRENEPRTADREPGPWRVIVGVVKNMGNAVGASVGETDAGHDPKKAGIYYPLMPGSISTAYVAARLTAGTDPSSFGPRLRAHADLADPSLQLQKVMSLDRVTGSDLDFYAFWIALLLLVSGIALLLALAGIYAVMSFTVARRTREIGIRVALGSTPAGVIKAVLRRPIIQVSLGLGAGVLLVTGLSGAVEGSRLNWGLAGAIAVYAVCMTVVCMLACLVPVRRALCVQPTDALRTDL